MEATMIQPSIQTTVPTKLNTFYTSTSSNKGGVGKTTTSVALILSAAELGLKCLYIEQDYGNPSGHKYLGLNGVVNPEEESGVGELLLGKISNLEEVIQKTFPFNDKVKKQFPNLDYVSCGTLEVSERSARTDFKEGYQKVKEEASRLEYEFVIFDMPAGVDPYVLDGVLRTNRILVVNPDPQYNSRDGVLRLLRKARTRAINALALGLKIPPAVKKSILEVLDKEFRKDQRDLLLGKIKGVIQKIAPEKTDVYNTMENYINKFESHAIFTNGSSDLCDQHMLDMQVEAEKYGVNISPLTHIPFSNSIRNAQPFFYYNEQIQEAAQKGQGPIPLIRKARDQLFKLARFPSAEEIKKMCGK
ncbi:AAA family ATPase [archaeon]|nr:AAA family ATPase [archaeon]